MWVVDLADPAAVDRLAGDAADELGGVDILVNNAGIPKRRHVTALDIATVEAVMSLNFLSPARLTLALLPQMLERGSGRIVNVSSVAAPLSSPGESAYDASKAALAVFSEAMAVDLWDTGVNVTVVYPGVVDTELFTLPDNDPFAGGVDAITVDEAVRHHPRGNRLGFARGLRPRVLRPVRVVQGPGRRRLPGRDGRLRARPGRACRAGSGRGRLSPGRPLRGGRDRQGGPPTPDARSPWRWPDRRPRTWSGTRSGRRSPPGG